jgi:hypothetical protein
LEAVIASAIANEKGRRRKKAEVRREKRITTAEYGF